MKAEILNIAKNLENDNLTINDARSLLLGLFGVSGSVLKDKDHYDALLDCCNGILDSVDAGKVPQRGIMGLKILLNR